MVVSRNILSISNNEVTKLLSIREAIELLEIFFKKNKTVTPARTYINLEKENIVLTCGDVEDDNISGFRAYWQFNNSQKFTDHITVVVDNIQNKLKGIITGNNLGFIRTGAIGGIAINYLSNKNSKILGVLGTGSQAKSQVLAALYVRSFEKVVIYSRNKENIYNFIKDIKEEHFNNIEFISASCCEEVVTQADVLICATNSKDPLFPKEWLKPGVHINAIGPKGLREHEIGIDVLDNCDFIFTDSLNQVYEYPTKTLLSISKLYNSILDLPNLLQENMIIPERKEHTISLFYSVGLSGTEVYLGNKILEKIR
ncbi:hypothetical protein P4388_01250 [Bacillus thuringiensis]|uniref:hypothetical protein n=1 Tax=Bacillus thuringiensis TaxID=1428 RepID=UPI001593CF6D|nr:hypothetical protein [Bacillus thuringiensis]MED3347308.1 hypothetical protein [Bacillus thuringiensis]HDX9692283.1 hypothetical protein [Bacillus thuringiensis]